jgi:putative component of membrane protein insertase Oxa1/YidC/SpoIIIJ protein YidD
MEYKVVPFVAAIANKGTAEHAALQLEQMIQLHASTGWQYVRLEHVTTSVAGDSGCFGLGATPPRTTSVSMVDGCVSKVKGLLLLIQLYWGMWPPGRRRHCLFRLSCSRFVYLATRRRGFVAGISALRLRVGQCRPGAYSFYHPVTHTWLLQLPNGEQVGVAEVARALRPERE